VDETRGRHGTAAAVCRRLVFIKKNTHLDLIATRARDPAVGQEGQGAARVKRFDGRGQSVRGQGAHRGFLFSLSVFLSCETQLASARSFTHSSQLLMRPAPARRSVLLLLLSGGGGPHRRALMSTAAPPANGGATAAGTSGAPAAAGAAAPSAAAAAAAPHPRTVPLGTVVTDAVRRWYEDALREAERGDVVRIANCVSFFLLIAPRTPRPRPPSSAGREKTDARARQHTYTHANAMRTLSLTYIRNETRKHTKKTLAEAAGIALANAA
jgi:hypothetical protein